jgi:FAD synthase
VIYGKGIAKKDLGFPTANLTISSSNQNKLISYPNGVYLVKFDIISGEANLVGKYYGVSLLGTNPHYENS